MNSSLRSFWIAGLLATSLAIAHAEVPAALQEAEEKEKAALAANATQREAKMAALVKWYAESLEVIQKHAQTTGDLDLAVAVKGESDRIAAASSPDEVAKFPPALQAVRGQFDKASAALTTWEQANNQAATRALLTELEALEKQLTRAAQIDEAVQVRKERAAVAGRLAANVPAVAASPAPPETPAASEPKPETATPPRAPKSPSVGVAQPPASVTHTKAVIPANSPDAFPIRDLHKGSRISLQYAGGKWKSWGHIASSSPEELAPATGELCKLVIALPSDGGRGGKVLAVVPGGTRGHPFFYTVEEDYPQLVLRINDKDDTYPGNPGEVEYNLEILPPKK